MLQRKKSQDVIFTLPKGPNNLGPEKSKPAYQSIMQGAETQAAGVMENTPAKLRGYFMQKRFYAWETREFISEVRPISQNINLGLAGEMMQMTDSNSGDLELRLVIRQATAQIPSDEQRCEELWRFAELLESVGLNAGQWLVNGDPTHPAFN